MSLSWPGALSAVVALVAVALGTPDSTAASWAALSVSPVSTLLVALIAGVGALVQSFSDRYLQADPRKGEFSALVGVVVSAMTLVAASASLGLLLAGWVTAGAAFLAVVSRRSDLPGVAVLKRSMRRSLFVGDACLLAAVALVWWKVGDLNLAPSLLLGGARQLGGLHDLGARLARRCLSCRAPGFGIESIAPGLPCAWCRRPSEEAALRIECCPRCGYEERTAIEGSVDPRRCSWCNP